MKALITGGCGFIGANYARRLLEQEWDVVVYDNLSRGDGCRFNLKWLVDWLADAPKHGSLVEVYGADVKDYPELKRWVRDCDLIVHAAAQVSVPLSVSKPDIDFTTNALGTFNVLEAARNSNVNPVIIYVSTNKVYGKPLEDKLISELDTRYEFSTAWPGVDESSPLKGEEPYGASKAVGDLYLYAYRQMYGLKTVSFRCGCMYGPRQWGKEEQGWVAWFCIATALGKPITIFGDGKQVRDLLYVDDVCRAFDLALEKKPWGEAFNLGGGRENAVSLLETIAYLEGLLGRKVNLRYEDWRRGDNKLYYADCLKAKEVLSWQPMVSWREGISKTYTWVMDHIDLMRKIYL